MIVINNIVYTVCQFAVNSNFQIKTLCDIRQTFLDVLQMSGGHLVHRRKKIGGPAQNLVDFVHQMMVFFEPWSPIGESQYPGAQLRYIFFLYTRFHLIPPNTIGDLARKS